jgi:hypothetical protein
VKPIELKMNSITSEFETPVPNIPETETLLRLKFPDCKITYSKFTDIWKVRGRNYSHTIWYNKNKPSKVITIRSKRDAQVILLNIVLFIAAVMLGLYAKKYNWLFGIEHIFIAWLAFVSSNNYFLRRIKPRYMGDFRDEHMMVLGKLQRLFIEAVAP